MKRNSQSGGAADPPEINETTVGIDRADKSPVGFRRPPRSAQFRKGQSGNPGGRPRRGHELAALLLAELDKSARVTVDGKRRLVSKREQIAKQLVDRSADADLRATKLLVDLLHKIEAPPPAPEPCRLDEADEKVLQLLLLRLGAVE
jgi:hypothetical protein